MRMYALVALATLLSAGCGKDDKKDNGNSTSNGAPATIPAAFTSSASSPADVSTKFSAYATAVLAPLRADLGSGSSGLADSSTATSTSATTTTTTTTTSSSGLPSFLPDTGIASQDFKSGADCGSLAKVFAGQFSQIDTILEEAQGAVGNAVSTGSATGTTTATGTASATGSSTASANGSSTASATASSTGTATTVDSTDVSQYLSLYDVQDLGAPADTRFSFEKKLTRKASATPSGGLGSILSFLLPASLDIEGGANDTQAAAELAVDWQIDIPADASSGTAASNTTMQTSSETFVDKTAQTLALGLSANVAMTGAAAANFSATLTMTANGGTTPSLSVVSDATGTSQGQPLAAHGEFTMTKTAANTYTVAIKANTNGTEVDKNLTVTLTGGACKVQ